MASHLGLQRHTFDFLFQWKAKEIELLGQFLDFIENQNRSLLDKKILR